MMLMVAGEAPPMTFSAAAGPLRMMTSRKLTSRMSPPAPPVSTTASVPLPLAPSKAIPEIVAKGRLTRSSGPAQLPARLMMVVLAPSPSRETGFSGL